MNKIRELTAPTIQSYDEVAESFWEGTRDHDVTQNMDALLTALTGKGPFRILDFGCGPGRDLAAFMERGHEPIGVEGSPTFCAMAREFSGAEVWNQNFLALDLPEGHFDGVFANATMFHIPSAELPRILGELRAALRPGGVLFSSNPRGQNEEGWNGDRYGCYHDIENWTRFLTAAGFDPIDHYYRPSGLPREEQRWLATTFRKPE